MLCAQNVTDYTVKGFLLDSISKEPVPYATIHIARKDNPGKPVKMLVTDVKGKFKEQLPSAGHYSITILPWVTVRLFVTFRRKRA